MPLVSIITINYNNAAALEKTIESVMNQGFDDKEYIVIDGGSNDESLNVIKKYSAGINYYVSEKDHGIYDAQNKGIKAARGKYLLFLNSGDFLCNNKVLQTVFSTQPVADIIYGNMRINWGNNSISTGKMPAVITAEHMYRDTLWHPVSFIKKELFENYGNYNQNYKLVADYDFFFKTIIANKVSTQYIDLEICEYNTEGQSSNPANKALEKEERRSVMQSYLSAEELAYFDAKFAEKKTIFGTILNFLKGKK